MEEYDVPLVLLENIYSLYGLEDDSNNKLYHYLYIKTCIVNDKKKAEKSDILKLILSELNIDTFSFDVVFYDKHYDLATLAIELLDNLEFMASLEGEVNLKKALDEVYLEGYKKSAKYRKLKEYKQYIKYNRLISLNTRYGISINPSYGLIEGFKYGDNHNPFKRTKEEELESFLNAEKFMGSNTTTHITEEDLEDYLIENLDLIEEGLVYLDRQVEIPGARIDILAKDKNGTICILELKIKEDKSIVWQVLYYPGEIKRKYWENNVRILTVAPNYSPHLLKVLETIDKVELYEYDINTINGKIKRLSVKKTNRNSK